MVVLSLLSAATVDKALLLCALGLSTDEADGVFATTVRAFCASLVLVVVVVVAVHVFVVQFRMATGDDGFLSHVCNSGDGESHTGWGERFI